MHFGWPKSLLLASTYDTHTHTHTQQYTNTYSHTLALQWRWHKMLAYFAAHSWAKRDDYMMNGDTSLLLACPLSPSLSFSSSFSLYVSLSVCVCINHAGLVVDCLGNSSSQAVIWLVLCRTTSTSTQISSRFPLWACTAIMCARAATVVCCDWIQSKQKL